MRPAVLPWSYHPRRSGDPGCTYRHNGGSGLWLPRCLPLSQGCCILLKDIPGLPAAHRKRYALPPLRQKTGHGFVKGGHCAWLAAPLPFPFDRCLFQEISLPLFLLPFLPFYQGQAPPAPAVLPFSLPEPVPLPARPCLPMRPFLPEHLPQNPPGMRLYCVFPLTSEHLHGNRFDGLPESPAVLQPQLFEQISFQHLVCHLL